MKKPTKEELEQTVKELKAQVESTSKLHAEMVQANNQKDEIIKSLISQQQNTLAMWAADK